MDGRLKSLGEVRLDGSGTDGVTAEPANPINPYMSAYDREAKARGVPPLFFR